MEIWSLWNVCEIGAKYVWKSIWEICLKSTKKAQEQCEWYLFCSGVFIVNFRGVGIENPVEHLWYIELLLIKVLTNKS